MSVSTLIQWADDTVNHVMGCSAPCELRPTPAQAREVTTNFFLNAFSDANPAEIIRLVGDVIKDHNATEIYQLRDCTVESLCLGLGAPILASLLKAAYKAALDERFICYAHAQTMMRGSDITNPDKRTNPGFPVQFEILKKFPGRMAEAAMRPDLYGRTRPSKPWLDYLPRTFFISDMGDSLSEEIGFDYLKQEIIDVISSPRGRQHLWLWLSKMPKRMAEFAEWLMSEHHLAWPDHLIPMTSVTSQKTVIRAEQLLKIPARYRGLSVEPLWEGVTLPLTGIHWCIVGGQSGPGAKPFDVAWIKSLQDQCRKSGTALFVKQLGSKPVSGTEPIALKDAHGGDWNEWPEVYRTRELPAGFWKLRVLHNSPIPTTPKGRVVKPRPMKPGPPKQRLNESGDEKLRAPASNHRIDTAPGVAIAAMDSQLPGATVEVSVPAAPSPTHEKPANPEAPATAMTDAALVPDRPAAAAAAKTTGEEVPHDGNSDGEAIPAQTSAGEEQSPAIPTGGSGGAEHVSGRPTSIHGVAKSGHVVRVTSDAQQRYQPVIKRQRFTYRSYAEEKGWGIWDKDIGGWYIEPAPGVRPPDLADLLPQVRALKSASANNNGEGTVPYTPTS